MFIYSLSGSVSRRYCLDLHSVYLLYMEYQLKLNLQAFPGYINVQLLSFRKRKCYAVIVLIAKVCLVSLIGCVDRCSPRLLHIKVVNRN